MQLTHGGRTFRCCHLDSKRFFHGHTSEATWLWLPMQDSATDINLAVGKESNWELANCIKQCGYWPCVSWYLIRYIPAILPVMNYGLSKYPWDSIFRSSKRLPCMVKRIPEFFVRNLQELWASPLTNPVSWASHRAPPHDRLSTFDLKKEVSGIWWAVRCREEDTEKRSL